MRREDKKRVENIENIFDKIMAENLPTLKKQTDIQVKEALRVSNKMSLKRSTSTYHN